MNKRSVVILAAGVGSRLGSYTQNRPKCLVELRPGVSILSTQLANIARYPDITSVYLVVGYKKEQIAHVVQKHPLASKITLVELPDFLSVNTAKSLAVGIQAVCMKEGKDTDIIQMNGDVVFDSRILGKLLSKYTEAPLLATVLGVCAEEEVKVVLKDDRVVSLGKRVEGIPVGEAVGINYFDGAFCQKLLASLMLTHEKNNKAYFEDAIAPLLEDTLVHICPTDNLPAVEIDFEQDLLRAREFFGE